MMQKRFSITAIVLALALMLSMILCACSGGVHGGKVKFDGVLSRQSYSEVVEAVNAFLAEEIVGEKSEISYVSYQKSADLTAREFLALGIGSAEVKSAEKGVVTYADTSESGVSVNKEHELYIITQSDGTIRYFAPSTRIGEMITRSEYDRIFRQDNYSCRLLYTSSMFEEKSECIYRFDGNKYRAEENLSVLYPFGDGSKMSTHGYTDMTDNQLESAYMEMNAMYDGTEMSIREYIKFVDGKFEGVYMDMGHGWSHHVLDYGDILGGIGDVMDMVQRYEYMFPFEMLERTSYGYAISADKIEAYTNELLGTVMEVLNLIIDMRIEYKDMYGNIGLYVKDGLLSECKGKLGGTLLMTIPYEAFGDVDKDFAEMFKSQMKSFGFDGEFDGQGNFNISQKIDMTYQGVFFDYGTTEIAEKELPTDLEEYMAQRRQ